ncbi:MAG: prolyl-tRNA synthetase associated domain-containing protein [Sphingomonadaceae bacterium]
MTMMSSAEQALYDALNGLAVKWSVHEHAAVFTVEESAQLHRDIAGWHTKNLFLKDAGGQFWLVTAPHDARVDLKALPAVIGAKKLSFGKAEDMERLIGITPGSVTPLAAVNDIARAVHVVIDARLASADIVNVHPLRNSATMSLAGADLITFLTYIGHAPQIVVLPTPG